MRTSPLFALTLAAATLAGLSGAGALRAEEAPKGKIVYCRKEGERVQLHVMNEDGTGDKELPGQVSDAVIFPSWSPDGKQIAYMAGPKLQGQEFMLGFCNADGTGHKTMPLAQKMAGLPAWSPDGKTLLFIAGEMMPEVYTAGPDGAGLRKISPDGKGGMFPFWMPDGKRIGYSQMTQSEMKTTLVLADPDGSNVETITGGEAFLISGAHSVSPDGKKLLYAGINPMTNEASLRLWDFTAKTETVIMDLTSTKEFGPESFAVATWAKDGKSFITNLPTDKGIGLFRVSEDGKTRTRLTPESTDSFAPALWSPK